MLPNETPDTRPFPRAVAWTNTTDPAAHYTTRAVDDSALETEVSARLAVSAAAEEGTHPIVVKIENEDGTTYLRTFSAVVFIDVQVSCTGWSDPPAQPPKLGCGKTTGLGPGIRGLGRCGQHCPGVGLVQCPACKGTVQPADEHAALARAQLSAD